MSCELCEHQDVLSVNLFFLVYPLAKGLIYTFLSFDTHELMSFVLFLSVEPQMSVSCSSLCSPLTFIFTLFQ